MTGTKSARKSRSLSRRSAATSTQTQKQPEVNRALSRRLEKLAQAALDTTRLIDGVWDWKPHLVRPFLVEVEALLPSAPADVVVKFTMPVNLISKHMQSSNPAGVCMAAKLLFRMLDESAGRPRRKIRRSRRTSYQVAADRRKILQRSGPA